MKNKKGRKKINLLKRMILGGLVILGCGSAICLLVPGFYSLFMNLLSMSINALSFALIGTAGIGLIIALGIATKCIEVETTYEFKNTDGLDENTEFMRSQLSVVHSKERMEEKTSIITSNKYSYVFDNNYEDTEDLIIDDIEVTYLEMVSGDMQKRGYSRGRTRSTGK